MPTVKDLIAELKQLGVRGYSKKLKGELMYMLVVAKKAKEEVKKPEPIKIAIKDIRAKRAKEREQEEEKELEDAENAMRADLNIGLKQIIPKKPVEKPKPKSISIKDLRAKRAKERDDMKWKQQAKEVERIIEEEKKKKPTYTDWIDEELIYNLRHNENLLHDEKTYIMSSLKDMIQKWMRNRTSVPKYEENIDHAHKLDNVLYTVLKPYARKKYIPIKTVMDALHTVIRYQI